MVCSACQDRGVRVGPHPDHVRLCPECGGAARPVPGAAASSALWQLLADLGPDAHRVFALNRSAFGRAPGAVAIADRSGAWPDTTDDGVLFVDIARPIVVEMHEQRLHARVPLVDEQLREFTTGMWLAAAVRTAALTGATLELSPATRAVRDALLAAQALVDRQPQPAG